MKILLSLIVAAAAFQQPKYGDFLKALSQKRGGWGAPTDRAASSHELCPQLTAPADGQVVCDQSTCALVCDQGFIALGRRRTKCRVSNAGEFFWKRTLGECKTCSDLAPPPLGIDIDCKFTSVGKKKCIYKSSNEDLDIVHDATGKRFGAIGAVCTCPRNSDGDRICGWKSQKLGGSLTDADIAEFRQQVPCDARSGADCPYSENFETRTKEIPSTLKPCGWTGESSSLSSRIVSGVVANHKHWPWYARLQFSQDNSNKESVCGGSIIDDRWVLTAAHCCINETNSPDKVIAFFNDPIDDDNVTEGEFSLTVRKENFFTHEKYDHAQMKKSDSKTKPDLCLIKFDESISAAGQGTHEICLAENYPKHGKACWVAGFGKKGKGEESPFSEEFRSTGVSIMSQQYCSKKSDNEKIFGSFAEEDICAGLPDVDLNNWTDGALENTYWDGQKPEQTNLDEFSKGTDACQSDSGGPLVCDVDGVATLVAVVSRGNGCAWEGFPGIYTSVSIDDWIDRTMAQHSTDSQ